CSPAGATVFATAARPGTMTTIMPSHPATRLGVLNGRLPGGAAPSNCQDAPPFPPHACLWQHGFGGQHRVHGRTLAKILPDYGNNTWS
ncbi:MAG: hypothetical protein ONB07_02915, partial [candidate division KSB1 bacterium]|nr:hypothetical protein [candidate division KSB1 bacterium]